MKNHSLLIALFAFLLALVGCEKETRNFSVGPFEVNSKTGIATGQALGVEFAVAGASQAQTESKIGTPDYSSGRATITLAADVTIELKQLEDNKGIAFQCNGKKYPTLTKGDKVVIDEVRKVTINGTEQEGK
ncbi:hypothetical protein SAMN02745181_3858 [Rubritalea squalenifaciens DSM 18772]|uniref:Lipoprotein n=1 Tax=Rubritalea squalenifaciens DSM 18772 TaxID=1123071 RepID=A0A1M6SQ12_9BACT|nr:hypothetical protein [Rubritalea squalenifaciens]SHK46785.1 hypothetical protein SAMN02745181_3858 [Rubritalea squalenifaciens DSM 18772]